MRGLAVVAIPGQRSSIATLLIALLLIGLAVVLAALPLEQAAAVATIGVLCGLAFVEPIVVLPVLTLAVPFSTVATVEAGDFAVTLVEPLVLLLGAVWAGKLIVQRRARLRGGPLAGALALLLLALLASTLAAERLGLAYKEIVKWVELIVIYLFCLDVLDRPWRRQAVIGALFIAGAIEALFGVYQYASGTGPATFAVGEGVRAFGHFEQPNPFAGYLGTIFPLALALSCRRPFTGLSLLAFAAAAASGLAIVLSFSRGAWLGALAAMWAMLWVSGPAGRRWLLPAVFGVALLVLLTVTSMLPSEWTSRLSSIGENFGVFDVRDVVVTRENFAVVERMAHWQAGWYMWLDHPLIGIGAGNYPAAYDVYSLPGWREALGHAHNYYLNMAAEAGLFGLFAWLLVLASVFRAVMAGLQTKVRGSPDRAMLIGLLGSFVVLATHSVFDNLLVHGIQVQVGLLLGLAMSGALASISAAAGPGPVAVRKHESA